MKEKNTRGIIHYGEYATRLGMNHLKPFQIEAVSAFVKGKDSLIVQPTAPGKNICLQVPVPMNKERFVLVISQTST